MSDEVKPKQAPDDWYELLCSTRDDAVEFKTAFMALFSASLRLQQKIQGDVTDWDGEYPAEWDGFQQQIEAMMPLYIREALYF